VNLYGPVGDLGVLVLSFASGLSDLGQQGAYLWLDFQPNLYRVFVLAGQSYTIPATKSFTHPLPADPTLAGDEPLQRHPAAIARDPKAAGVEAR
jgi:hypothetical protein